MRTHLQDTLKTEAICSSELLVKIYHVTIVRRHITERGNLLRPTLKLPSPCLSFKNVWEVTRYTAKYVIMKTVSMRSHLNVVFLEFSSYPSVLFFLLYSLSRFSATVSD